MGHVEGNFTPVQYIWDARFLKVKEEALDHTVWGTGFGRGCGPVGVSNYIVSFILTTMTNTVVWDVTSRSAV